MRIADIVTANEGFQTSVNIDFDFGSPDKVRSLIPTDSVCRYVEEILKDVISPSSQRAKLLVGPYGTGKSHITLAALSSMWYKDPALYGRIAGAYKAKGLPFGETFEQFASGGPRLLPVIISGSSSDLQHSLLFALRTALRVAGLERLMPQTNFSGVLDVIGRWRREYPETLARFEEAVGCSASSFEERMGRMDTAAYSEFVSAYPRLTSGGSFDPLEGSDVISIYEAVLAGLVKEGISGIYVVYDEFSKYLESNIGSATVEDTKLLQDFAEKCSRSTQDRQLHMLLISHKSLSNYIDAKLPKDKVDGWRGVSGRFKELEIANSPGQSYELISEAVLKDPAMWEAWLSEDGGANRRLLDALARRYVASGLFEEADAERAVHGCFPLHPVSAYLLPRLSAKVAQNERTLFTFLCSAEPGALQSLLAGTPLFVSPDSIFDYFEPLLKREYYASSVFKAYELARSSLSRVDAGSLEARLVKAIALLSMVEQYKAAPPTRQLLVEVYGDCGFPEEEVEAALSHLVDGESVVYLRQSNSLLKLKESSGVRIDAAIADRADFLRSRLTPCGVLNAYCTSKVLYPSRHNEENAIVRYFDCGFASSSDLEDAEAGERLLAGLGDGAVVAVHVDSPDSMAHVGDWASAFTEGRPMTVVVVPKRYADVDDVLYRYAAATALKEEARGDEVLAEEYEIALEDYAETLDAYVDGFFRPETGRSAYYACGSRKYKINRRRQLSDLLSKLCDDAFPLTPVITNESLNKNELTGIALHSRAKVISGLCAPSLAPNLGFVGSGQETAMMRSALQRTGLIPDLAAPSFERRPKDDKIAHVVSVVESFVTTAHGSGFDELYRQLTGPEGGIGMKRGPIPMILALVLREHRNEVVITRDGSERPFGAELVEDIAVSPASYEISQLDWSPEMARYTERLGELFGCPQGAGRAQIVESMRLWYAALPQLVRNSRENHTGRPLADEALRRHREFGRAIRRVDLDSSVLLFDALPKALGIPFEDPALVEAVRAEKDYCDGCVELVHAALGEELKTLFAPGAPKEASLDSALRDWAESLPEGSSSHVFSGTSNQILAAVRGSTSDTRATVARIAKAATSLRIEDWNDAMFKSFAEQVAKVKVEAESFEAEEAGAAAGGGASLSISFADEQGRECRKVFASVECPGRARLLRSSIESCIAEMGASLSPDEKRQVVFDVLRGMC